ncbi:MAG: phage GP46 family protein [Sodalis sp. (in: enterobacteria)]|uniref:phage GP46 family protein n=1 Tax=Sodalis sp. (in: enterobacteria) TaxID=1898979 RepID=UPI00073D3254
MSDAALRWMNGEGVLVQAGADLLADDSLTTTVLLCLFTDRRAEVSDRLPDGGHDRRGWWADSYRDRPVGSRLWLLSREKALPAVLARAEAYADEALRGLLDAGMISQLHCQASAPLPGWLRLTVRLTLKDGSARPFTFKARLEGM